MTNRKDITMKRTLIIGLALVTSLVAASPALADSITYVKDHNVWIADPDGAKQHRVTNDGTADWPYRSPSQADDGTIAAAHGTDIVRLRQNGAVLSKFDPPDTTDSAGQHIGGHPVQVAVSPDGRMVAYTYYQANCPPGAPCGTRYVMLYSHAGRATPVETFGKIYRNNPAWTSNDRLLAFGGFLHQVNHDSPGGGNESDVHWFDDSDLFGMGDSEDLGDGELSRQGDRLVTIRSYAENTHLMMYKVTGGVTGGAPAYACNTGNEHTLDSPGWSEDGRRLMFAHKDGIEVLPLPSVDEGCPGAGSGTVVIPGGSEPDWGPANVNPGPPPPPPCVSNCDGKTDVKKTVSPRAKCMAKPSKSARKRCLRAVAVKKCQQKKTKAQRKRCIRNVNRRMK